MRALWSLSRRLATERRPIDRPIIYFDVLPGRTVPGIVLSHAPHLKPPPVFRLPIGGQGALDCGEKRSRCVFAKDESGRRRSVGALVLDRIEQTPDSVDDRHRAVSQTVHLIE